MMSGIDRVLDLIRPGDRVFVAGSSGEPTALLEAWTRDPDRTRDLEIFTTTVPGINRFPIDRLHHTARISGLFMQPGLADAQRDGRYRHLPVSYAGFARQLMDGRMGFDVCIVQTATPGADGLASMGPAVEFMPLVRAASRATAVLVNASTPPVGSAVVDLSDVRVVDETDTPVPVYDTGDPDPISVTIAEQISHLIDDGATIQVGLGKTPAALLASLHERRRLRLHTGMYGDSVMGLANAGALDDDYRHLACVFAGRPELYDWASRQDQLELADCATTHGARTLAGLDRFVAVNSALEVDLWGQAALEHVGGAGVSGAGGAPDFARAARLSPGGLSVVAVPATARGGDQSRIVARLTDPGVATLPRTDIDVVVTEHGVADLRGHSVHERAERLIEIAAPNHRSYLREAWRSFASRL